MSRLRGWLGRSVSLSLTRAELLAIVLVAVVVTLVWPAAPLWLFVVVGVVIGLGERMWCDVRNWQRKRATR